MFVSNMLLFNDVRQVQRLFVAARERLVAAMEAMNASTSTENQTDAAAIGANADSAQGSRPEPRTDSRGAVGPLLAAARAWLP